MVVVIVVELREVILGVDRIGGMLGVRSEGLIVVR